MEAKSLRAARDDRDRFVAFAFAAADLVVETDDAGRIRFAAGAGDSVLGQDVEGLIGSNFFALIQAEDRNAVETALHQLSPGRRLSTLAVRSSHGEHRQIGIRAYRLPEGTDRVFLSISRAKPEVTPSAREAVSRDAATGLLDKEGFSESVQQRVRHAREAGEDCSMTMVDMSGLEVVRPHLDEDAELELIAQVTSILQSGSVDGDSAGRIDNDKFAVLHGPSLDVGGLTGTIESLVRASTPWASDFSVDSSTMDLDTVGMTEEETSQAVLYTLNKYSESNPRDFSLTKLSDGCRDMLSETLAWQRRIKTTISEGGFSLAFQPIVDLRDKTVHHFEALTRFPNQPNGTPFHFITMAEQLGNIAEFDLCVAQRVIDALRDAGPERALPIAVNVSGKSLATPGFVDALVALINRNTDLSEHLLFEVTESSKIMDLQAANRALQAIRQLNFHVCLDDFGVGAATFEYLRSLRVDYVKIDGSFVKDLARSKFSRAFIKSVATMCRDLDVMTIAEMIENEKTAGQLCSAGVMLGQGWHLGRPQAVLPWEQDAAQRVSKSVRGQPRWDPVQGKRLSAYEVICRLK